MKGDNTRTHTRTVDTLDSRSPNIGPVLSAGPTEAVEYIGRVRVIFHGAVYSPFHLKRLF